MEKITQKEVDELKAKACDLAEEIDKKVAAIGLEFLANKGAEEPPLYLCDMTDELSHLRYRIEASIDYIDKLCEFTAKENEK